MPLPISTLHQGRGDVLLYYGALAAAFSARLGAQSPLVRELDVAVAEMGA